MPLTPSCDQIIITEWPAVCAVAVYTISQSSARVRIRPYWGWFRFGRHLTTFLIIFRLDALALSVIATATWLAGWVGGWLAVCHSRYCIKTTKRI